MKFKNRHERLIVNEIMTSLLVPLRAHCDERTRECITMTLRLLQESEIEDYHEGDKE